AFVDVSARLSTACRCFPRARHTVPLSVGAMDIFQAFVLLNSYGVGLLGAIAGRSPYVVASSGIALSTAKQYATLADVLFRPRRLPTPPARVGCACRTARIKRGASLDGKQARQEAQKAWHRVETARRTHRTSRHLRRTRCLWSTTCERGSRRDTKRTGCAHRPRCRRHAHD